MSEKVPQSDPSQPLWLQQLNKSLSAGSVIFGPVNHRKHINSLDPGMFFNQKGRSGRTDFSSINQSPLLPLETDLARNELGMTEQEVERLSRFSGKSWLNAMGVEYPKEWE